MITTTTLDPRLYRKDGTPRTSKKANALRKQMQDEAHARKRADEKAYALYTAQAKANAPRRRETDEIYDKANRIVNRALRNIERNTPTPLIKSLIDLTSADTHARRAVEIENARADAKARHDEALADVQEYRRQTKRKNQTETEKATAEINLAEAREALGEASEEMTDLDIITTLSIRADLVQEACASLSEWEHGNGRSGKVCYLWYRTLGGVKRFARPCKSAQESASTIQAIYTALDEFLNAVEGVSPEEIACVINKAIDTQARGRYCTNAVSRYIHGTRSPIALNTTHTDSRKATPEDIAQFVWRFGEEAMNPDYARIVTPSGYLTLRSNPENHDIEIVHHRQTIRQNQTLFAGTSEDGTDEVQYVRRASAYELTMADLDNFADLVSVAELTDRERRFLKALQMPEAQQAGQTASDDYTRKHFVNGHWDGKPSECIKARSNARFTAWRGNALEKIGLHHGTPVASNFWKRLVDKLRSAAPHAHRSQRTPETIALAHMMQSSYRGNPLAVTQRPDLIGAMEGASKTKPKVVFFVRLHEYCDPDTGIITPAMYTSGTAYQSAQDIIAWTGARKPVTHRHPEPEREPQISKMSKEELEEYMRIHYSYTRAETLEEIDHARRLYAEAEARKKAIAEAESEAHRNRLQELKKTVLSWERLQELKPWLTDTTTDRTPDGLQDIPGTPYATTRTPKKQ